MSFWANSHKLGWATDAQLKRARELGIDFSDKKFDLAIDKTVEKLTEAGVINAHLKK